LTMESVTLQELRRRYCILQHRKSTDVVPLFCPLCVHISRFSGKPTSWSLVYWDTVTMVANSVDLHSRSFGQRIAHLDIVWRSEMWDLPPSCWPYISNHVCREMFSKGIGISFYKNSGKISAAL
jgi:hypothetical protein